MFKQIFNLASKFTCPLLNTSKTIVQNVPKPNIVYPVFSRNIYTIFSQKYTGHILIQELNFRQSNQETIRTVTKYSWGKGKRKSEQTVLRRFYRLHWGGWIRTRCGRRKKLWKKSPARKRRLRQHVFCNATQCTLLDKLVGSYWKKPKYYVDDPYGPYHTREEFILSAKKPRPYIPPEER